MRKLWITLLLLVPLLTSAQQKNLFTYGTGGMGAVQGTDLLVTARGTTFYNPTVIQALQYLAAQISGSCTMSPTFVITCSGGGGASTFDQLGSGNNTTATMTCSGSGGTNCMVTYSNTGIVNSNWFDGAAFPIGASIVGTNMAGQLVSENTQTYPPLTAAAYNAIGCSAVNAGTHGVQSDVVSFPPMRGAAIAGGGTAGQWPIECLANTGVYHWTYL